ncbi:hypothetical protein M9458_007330, partial [Cirrhinus mrigala]
PVSRWLISRSCPLKSDLHSRDTERRSQQAVQHTARYCSQPSSAARSSPPDGSVPCDNDPMYFPLWLKSMQEKSSRRPNGAFVI